MLKNLILIAMSMVLVSGQRPSFAGNRPIGYPEIIKPTTEGLGNRFGEEDVPTTTVRLPIEAKGDKDLVDRLSKLPIDQQPFWLINWHALEEHRRNPQTYPQKPNVFVDPTTNQQQASQQSFQQQQQQQQSSQQQFSQLQPVQQQTLQQQQQSLQQQQEQLNRERQKFMELQQQFFQQQNQLANRNGFESVTSTMNTENLGFNVQMPNRLPVNNDGRGFSMNHHHHHLGNKPRMPSFDN